MKKTEKFFKDAYCLKSSETFLYQEIDRRCLEKTDLIKINPKVILNFNGMGDFSVNHLQAKYPEALVITVDLRDYLLGKSIDAWVAQQSCDMVYSNLALHWIADLGPLLTDLKQALKPNGLLIFSCFGVDTFSELRKAFQAVDDYEHVNQFYDMHDIGDGLLALQFADPVMDMQTLVVDYPNIEILFEDIKKVYGPLQALNYRKSLMTKRQLEKLIKAYSSLSQSSTEIPVTFEIIYGHAWKPDIAPQSQNAAGEVVVPLERLLKTKK